MMLICSFILFVNLYIICILYVLYVYQIFLAHPFQRFFKCEISVEYSYVNYEAQHYFETFFLPLKKSITIFESFKFVNLLYIRQKSYCIFDLYMFLKSFLFLDKYIYLKYFFCEKRNGSIPLGIEPRTFRLPENVEH